MGIWINYQGIDLYTISGTFSLWWWPIIISYAIGFIITGIMLWDGRKNNSFHEDGPWFYFWFIAMSPFLLLPLFTALPMVIVLHYLEKRKLGGENQYEPWQASTFGEAVLNPSKAMIDEKKDNTGFELKLPPSFYERMLSEEDDGFYSVGGLLVKLGLYPKDSKGEEKLTDNAGDP